MNHPGFYSVVRFCPDIERGEMVNVGVVIGSPALGMRVRMSERNEYVKKRFGAEAFDDTRLTLTKDGLAERLRAVEPTAEALFSFGAAEAGKLQLSPPRLMVVTEDLVGEVLALFQRLVEDPEIARRERRLPKPDLKPFIRQLQSRSVPIQRRPEVSIPILEESLTADFAFQNGVRNLVKAVGLSGREETAMEEASELGSKGLLLAKHGADGARSKLIVVADIDDHGLRQRVHRLLDDHEVRFVEEEELPTFADEIAREAH